jgi:hypothetical protein
MIMQLEGKKIYMPKEYLDFEVNSDARHPLCHHLG